MFKSKIVFFISFFIFCNSLYAQEETLISFKIEDQYEKEYTENSWQDSVLVVFGSDKEGAKYNKVWAKALYENYKKEALKIPIAYVGIADLSSVPFFLKTTVRKFFLKENANGIMMDWEGIFPDAYNFKEDHCNILLFDYNRNMIYKTAVTQLEDKKVAEIMHLFKTIKSTKNNLKIQNK